jgi:hypothetical protein
MQVLQENLRIVEEKIDNEVKKNFRRRDYRLLKFLHKERDVWKMAILQLKWFLNELPAERDPVL